VTSIAHYAAGTSRPKVGEGYLPEAIAAACAPTLA
jgi:hypothetical protein